MKNPLRIIIAGALVVAGLSSALAQSTAAQPTADPRAQHPVLTADVFRLVRTEQEPITKLTYGIFAFRHHHATQIKMWGWDPPDGRRFSPANPQYEFRTETDWHELRMAYCGTGMEAYVIRPGVDYQLRIPLYVYYPIQGPYLGQFDSTGKELRISLPSRQGVFRSDPFYSPVVGDSIWKTER